MKFYNREKELASLEKVRQVSFSVHSQMTVLTGRRRIGKTSLIFKSARILLRCTCLSAEVMKRISVYALLSRSSRHLIFMYRNLPTLQKCSAS